MQEDPFGFVLGCALGDGCIGKSKRDRSATLIISRKAAHAPYAQWQLERLNAILGTRANLRDFMDKGKYPAVRFGVTDSRVLVAARNLLYPRGVKYFSSDLLSCLGPEALALFWMDDGSLEVRRRQRPRSIKIERSGWLPTSHDPEQAQNIAKWIYELTGASGSKVTHRSGMIYLRWFSRQFRLLAEGIQEYVHPCLAYKVDLNRTGTVAEWLLSESQRAQA